MAIGLGICLDTVEDATLRYRSVSMLGFNSKASTGRLPVDSTVVGAQVAHPNNPMDPIGLWFLLNVLPSTLPR